MKLLASVPEAYGRSDFQLWFRIENWTIFCRVMAIYVKMAVFLLKTNDLPDCLKAWGAFNRADVLIGDNMLIRPTKKIDWIFCINARVGSSLF